MFYTVSLSRWLSTCLLKTHMGGLANLNCANMWLVPHSGNIFSPCTLYFQDRLQIHCEHDQDKLLTWRWMNDLLYLWMRLCAFVQIIKAVSQVVLFFFLLLTRGKCFLFSYYKPSFINLCFIYAMWVANSKLFFYLPSALCWSFRDGGCCCLSSVC